MIMYRYRYRYRDSPSTAVTDRYRMLALLALH